MNGYLLTPTEKPLKDRHEFQSKETHNLLYSPPRRTQGAPVSSPSQMTTICQHILKLLHPAVLRELCAVLGFETGPAMRKT